MKTKTWLILAGAFLLLLAPREAKGTGACTCARFHDWQDMGCNQNFTGAGGPPKARCPDCPGMPRWWVSEPYVNLCLTDTPLSYRLSSGKEMAFTFYYRQRTKLPDSDEVPVLPVAGGYEIYPGLTGSTCGTNASWGNNWTMSITIWDPNWDNSWTPFGANMVPPPSGSYPVYSRGYQAFVWRPEGGINSFNIQAGYQNTIDPQSQMRLTSVVSGQNYPAVETGVSSTQANNMPAADANGIYWGDSGIGLKLVYPDGSQEVFGLSAYPITDYAIPAYVGTASASTERLFLTQRIDPQGRVTRLGYEVVTNAGSSFYRVRYVVDPDYRTNTFLYNSGFQLREIDDPFGRTAQLLYTNLYGGMAAPKGITDAAGLTSSFGYYQAEPTNGWIIALTTPYGTTRFNYYAVADSSVTDGYQQRAIYVSEPEGAQQLYLYQHQNPGIVSATEPAPNVPGQTNFDDGTSGSTPHYALTYRDTFHWGRRQYAALAANSPFNAYMGASLNEQFSNPASSQSAFASALSALAAADYTKAGEKHWLMLAADDVSITEGLSSERDPSPDPAGQIPGLRTWYDYSGKPSPELLGNDPQITCIARLLPNGDSQYTAYNYYPTVGIPYSPAGAGMISNSASSYTLPDGGAGVLLNWYGYAPNGIDLASVSNSAGQHVNYGYNGSHQITAITNALNQVTTLTWDTYYPNNLTGVQFASGQSIGLSHYPFSLSPTNTSALVQQVTVLPAGRTFTFNGYSAGLPSSVTDDRGLNTTNTWDGLNRLTSTSFPDNTSISNIYVRLDLAATKDRLGKWAYYAYDGLQHLTNVINANGAATAYAWCGCGSLSTIIDAQNGAANPTSLNYDNQGNLLNVIFPDTSRVNWQYDLAGRMTNVCDGAGNYLQFAYNNQGLPTSVTNANGLLQSIVYDALNRPINVTDANGVTVTNQYDALNELLQRTWPDGHGEGYGYATNGLIAFTNRDGKATFYTRDGAGRKLAEWNANQELTRFAYDSLDHLTNLWDGNTNQTHWQYNEYGWLTNKVDGLGRNAFRYAYNANGWVTNRWTPEKGNTGYAHDNVGNLKSIVYPQSSILYSYDALNRLTNMLDATGTNRFSYTPTGQLQSESGPWPNDTVTCSYVQGLRTALSLAQPGGTWSQSYAYDPGWRMTNTVSPAGAFGYAYNANVGPSVPAASPLVGSIALPNGANIVNTYDALARQTGTALNNYWGHTLDGYSYMPDPLGLRTNILRNLGLTTNSVSVGYDNIAQITSWQAKEGSGTPRLNEQLGWAYDPAHNLHSRTNGNLSQIFTTDAADELTNVTRAGTFTLSGATPAPAVSVAVNGQPAQTNGDFTFAATNLLLKNGANTFTSIAVNLYGLSMTNTLSLNLPTIVVLGYDSNGNLTNDGVRTFAYDSENQLTNVTVANAFRKDFVFDGLNRLRIKREFSWAKSGWTLTNEVHFIYAGNVIIQQRNSNNVPTLTLTRGLDLSGSLQGAGGIGGLLAMTDGSGANYFYHQDALGSVTALMDATENIVARREMDGFGRTINLIGSKTGINPFWCFGQLYDEDTRLAHFKDRDYTTDLMRWLNQDPIGERGGNNLYRFVGNNPVNLIDPFGLYGNPVSGPSGPVGPSSYYTPSINYPSGQFNNPPYSAPQPSGYGFDVATPLYPPDLGNLNSLPWSFPSSAPGPLGGINDGPIEEDPLGYAILGGVAGLLDDAGDAAALSGGKVKCPAKRTFSAADRAAGLKNATDASGVPRCQYCGTQLTTKPGFPNSYEADHTIPYSRGGPTTPDNLTPSCRTCNRSKGAQTPSEWGGP